MNHSEGRINLTKAFNVTKVKGYWGEWSPATCLNMTSEGADCFKEAEDYYDYLDRVISEGNATSSYDFP